MAKLAPATKPLQKIIANSKLFMRQPQIERIKNPKAKIKLNKANNNSLVILTTSFIFLYILYYKFL